MSADPATVGARVLAGFDKGRAIAIAVQVAKGERSRTLVRRALDHDILEGHGERGRAIRITERLHGRVSQRQVYRHLAALNSAAS